MDGRQRRSRELQDAAKTKRLDAREVRELTERSMARDAVRPSLVVMSGKLVGKRVRLDGLLLVGRDPAAELVLLEEDVSWHHARVEDRGDAYVLVDLGSTNGTHVNESRVQETVLARNDRIYFGATLCRFEIHDSVESAFYEQVERLLEEDDLTGLYVRRKFDAELDILLHQAEVEGREVGLLAMDLDGVKQINDAHGHIFGAHLIAETGKLIGRIVGTRGFAARFGGDEFLAALRDHDLAAASNAAAEIREQVAAHVIHFEGIDLRIAISIGVAAYPESGTNGSTLVRAADAALYRAKRAGGNAVHT